MKIFGSEITPHTTYLNRRKFIKSTMATSIAATFSSQVSAKHEDEKKTYNEQIKCNLYRKVIIYII